MNADGDPRTLYLENVVGRLERLPCGLAEPASTSDVLGFVIQRHDVSDPLGGHVIPTLSFFHALQSASAVDAESLGDGVAGVSPALAGVLGDVGGAAARPFDARGAVWPLAFAVEHG